jgi:hypothetical protein
MLARAALLALLAIAAAAPRAEARSAIVIVVENNQSAASAGGSTWLRALDRFGEPAYAEALRAIATGCWDRVEVLTDADASFASVASRLRALDAEGYVIDLLLDVHGSSRESRLGNRTSGGPDRLYFTGRPATPEDVAALGRPHPLRLNAVYMVSCWGSRFNEAWRQAGAQAANGARELNYYVIVSPAVFLEEFAAGADLAHAAERAYRAEARLLDHKFIDRLLAREYGAGVERIQGARSSERVQAGPAVRAAFFSAGTTAREAKLF